jgi:hypothetical protein
LLLLLPLLFGFPEHKVGNKRLQGCLNGQSSVMHLCPCNTRTATYTKTGATAAAGAATAAGCENCPLQIAHHAPLPCAQTIHSAAKSAASAASLPTPRGKLVLQDVARTLRWQMAHHASAPLPHAMLKS